MMRINRDNKIFQSEEYRKDRNKFNIIELNFNSKDLLLYSDEENYVICRGAVGRPTWIWTVDGIGETRMKEVVDVITEFYLTDCVKDKFTAKKEFYEFLKKTNYPYLNTEDYFEMGALECHQVKEPRKCDGYLGKPKLEDLDILAQYWYEDNREMNGFDSISMQQAYEDIKHMIDSNAFFVWRNDADKIVCMVNYQITGDRVKLSHVYTPQEERRKGYASNLIYHVTEALIEQQLVPLLYTDYNYVASNKAYKNAGYEDMGILINFSCSIN